MEDRGQSTTEVNRKNKHTYCTPASSANTNRNLFFKRKVRTSTQGKVGTKEGTKVGTKVSSREQGVPPWL